MQKFKTVLNILSWILSFFIFFFAVTIVVLLLTGYKIFSVSTGSMEPTYPVGSIVIVKPADFDTLDIDDVITFKSGGAVITHRIVRIENENQLISTKGDNNSVEDYAPIPYENVIGRVVYGVKWLGYPVLFGKTKLGIIVYTNIIIFIFLARVITSYSEDDNEDYDENEENEI